MKKVVLSFLLLSALLIDVSAQKPLFDNEKTVNGKKVAKDSIPALPDSVYFISNNDLAMAQKVIKSIMSSPQYLQVDGITQYEILISNLNQVFIAARKRWEQENKVR